MNQKKPICQCGCGQRAKRNGSIFASREHYRTWLRDPANAGRVTAMIQKGHKTRLRRAKNRAESQFASKAQAWAAGHRQGRASERAFWSARWRRSLQGVA